MVLGLIGGIASGIFGSISASSERRRQEEARRQAAQEAYERDLEVYQWQNNVAQQQYEFDLARNQILREVQAQAAEDYRIQQEKVLAAALESLKINTQALRDQYRRAERIRAKQEVMSYEQQQAQLKSGLDEAWRQQGVAQQQALIDAQRATDRDVFTQRELGLQADDISREASYESFMTGLNLVEETRQYLMQGRQLQSQLDQTRNATERQTQQLLSSLALEEQGEYLGWQLEQIQSIAQGSVVANRTVAQQGGGATAKRLSIESAQALGRTWAQLTLAGRSRDLRIRLASDEISEGLGAQWARAALQMQDFNDRSLFAIASAKRRQQNTRETAGIRLKQTDLRSQQSRAQFRTDMRGANLSLTNSLGVMRFALDSAQRDFKFNKDMFTKVVLPGFRLAHRQGIRELKALQLNTQRIVDNATIPYRGDVIFDPQAPIPGLPPKLGEFSSYGGTGSQVGQALLAGAAGGFNSWVNSGGLNNLFGGGNNFNFGNSATSFADSFNTNLSGIGSIGSTDFSSVNFSL